MKKNIFPFLLCGVLALGACGNSSNTMDDDAKDESVASESIDDVNQEEATVPQDDALDEFNDDTGEGYLEGMGDVKVVGIGYNDEVGIDGTDSPLKPLKMGSMQLEISSVDVLDIKTDEEVRDMFFEGETEIRAVVIDMKVENTTEEDITFDPNLSTIVTNTGEQLEPLIFLSGEAGGDFLGKVKKEGQTWWMLNNKEEDVTEVKLIIAPPYATDDMEDTAEEKRIEFDILSFKEAKKKDGTTK